MRLAALAVVVGAVLAAGCGSTVAQRDLGSPSGEAGLGTGLVVPTASGGPPGISDGPQGMTPPGDAAEPATGSSSMGGSVGDPASPIAAGGAPATPRSAGGAVATGPIQIGVLLTKNAAAYGDAFGADLNAGDAQAQAQAVVAEVNRTGGVGGRRVDPVFATVDPTSSQPYASQAQAICDHWTQDNRVEVAVSSVVAFAPELLPSCLQQRGVAYLTNDLLGVDDTTLRSLTGYVNPGSPSLDRLAGALVDGFAATGFLTKSSRIGLVRYDTPYQQRPAQRSLKPALARHGLQLVSEAAVPWPDSLSGSGPSVSAVQSAVLRFRSDGVTHAMFLAHGMSFMFMTVAEQQGYRPAYALSSVDEAALLLQGTVPPAQLEKARGLGWRPTADVDAGKDPGGNPTVVRCKHVMARAGQDVSTRVKQESAYAYCDGLFLLQAAGGRGALDRQSAVTRIESLGTTYRSALALRSRFGPGRHDGPMALRPFAFRSDCSCFAYTSSADSAF